MFDRNKQKGLCRTEVTGTLQGKSNRVSVGQKQTTDTLNDKRSNRDSTGQKQIIDTLQDRRK
jgi:hypothetical protein